MLRCLTDEDFDERLVRGLLARLPHLDLVAVRDVGLTGRDDHEVLAWAAERGRVLLTHDVTTMTRFAYDRIAAGDPMPGVFVIHQSSRIGSVIEALVQLVTHSREGEWEGQVRFLRRY